ncbi:putative inorganic carbon (HCO3(-)) transporter [Bradyrhizobium sp. USDA 4474]
MMTDTAGLDCPAKTALAPLSFTATSIRSGNVETLLRWVVFAILLTRSVCDPIFGLSSTDLGGSTISFGAVVNVLVIAIALLYMVRRPSTVPFAIFAMWAPFLIVTFGATLYTPQFTSAAKLAVGILSNWAMFVLPLYMFRSPADLRRFVLLIFASSIVPSGYGVWEILMGGSYADDFRLASTFTHPNIFAFYLVLLIGLALFVLASPSGRWPRGERCLIALYMLVLILLLVFTKTRGAWAAGGLTLLFYAVWLDRRLLVGFIALPLLLVTPTPISDRLSDLGNGQEIESLKQLNANSQFNSAAWREALWRSAIPSIVEQPILGHGLDSFRTSTPEFFPLADPAGIDAHNLYLQLLFEMGIVGLAAYLWLLGSAARWILEGLRYDPNAIAVALSILAAYALESSADNMIYYLAFNWYFMFALGTIGAWIEYHKRTDRGRRPRRHVGGISIDAHARDKLPPFEPRPRRWISAWHRAAAEGVFRTEQYWPTQAITVAELRFVRCGVADLCNREASDLYGSGPAAGLRPAGCDGFAGGDLAWQRRHSAATKPGRAAWFEGGLGKSHRCIEPD